jgi:hypothetical protein
MKPVTFDLQAGSQGRLVASLQDALVILLARGRILSGDPQFRHELLEAMEAEHSETAFRDATQKIVSIFQEEHGLEPQGVVDERTARALNSMLRDLGLLDEEEQPPSQNERARLVSGTVHSDVGLPLAGVLVRASGEGERSAVRLGEDTTGPDGAYTIRYDMLPGRLAVRVRLTAFGADGRVLASANADNTSDDQVVYLVVSEVGGGATRHSIVGRVSLEDGRPAANVDLLLKRRGFGGGATPLATFTTLADGRYALSFDPDSAGSGLHIAAQVGDKELPLSAQLNYLGRDETITRDLIAPNDLATQQPPEFRRLASDLQTQIGDITELAGAQETVDRQDLTVLSRAIRWDARLLALGALAARLSADEQTPTSVEGFYGLLRAGLPSDKVLLAQVKPEVAEKTLRAVREAGIIEMSTDEIAEFTTGFQRFSVSVRLSLPVPGGNTSYGDMLAVASLPEGKREAFADVFLEHGSDPSQLWTKAREKGLTEPEVAGLQLQGKLAFLAGGSKDMTAWLMKKPAVGAEGAAPAPLSEPSQLVDMGLYSAEQWDAELFSAAAEAGQSVDDLIPSRYVGSAAQRRQIYTDEMARKVRVSYPMQVLAHRIDADADGFVLGDAAGPTTKLLRSVAPHGFRLGTTPVDSFVDAYSGASGLSAAEVAVAKSGLKDLARTYQISPNDAVMKTMRKHGLLTAQDVTGMSKKHFLDFYGPLFENSQQAGLVHRKAEQVSSMVYNLFTIANQVESQVVVYGASAPADERQGVKNELIKHYPTLETLFGSMDFCECEHCRSVLSPAAYLVDLLQYVEAEGAARAGFDSTWKQRHGGKDYAASEAMPGVNYATPYDALMERRPDLIHIPLSCENTHTALPYIDIVNEILEYFVANGALHADAAHDSGEATTAELLAEPQNVVRDAYATLRKARYPLTLPFDLWLETVRQFCQFFETPLADVLEVFRAGDDLVVLNQPYGREAVFIESLGLSPAEAKIFTDADPLAGGKWFELFGYAMTSHATADVTNAAPDATLTLPNAIGSAFEADNPVTYRAAGVVHGESRTIKTIGDPDSGGAGRRRITLDGVWAIPPADGDELILAVSALLSSAKTLSRRLGVTYKQLVELVQTGFVNPELVKLTLLYKLAATVADVFFYRDHRVFYETNSDLRGTERTNLSPTDQARYDALANSDLTTGLRGWDIVDRVGALVDRLTDASVEFSTPADPFDAQAWVDTTLAADGFDKVLVLADSNAGSSFDATMLRYANGQPADELVFVRLNLLVRLWRKLGWTIEETDRALATFTRPIPYTAANLPAKPLRAALLYIAHMKQLVDRLRIGKDARHKLMTLWSDIPTTGNRPLYAQLFLTRNVLKSDPIFDDPLGQYLDKPTILIKHHVTALQAALGMTANDINRILTDSSVDPVTAPMTLPNVSLLYRYGLLAKSLKLSIADLITLKALSGLDPFAPLTTAPLTTLADDHPFSQTLRFVEVADEVKGSGLSSEDLGYLLRHEFDPTGQYRPNHETTLALPRTIAAGIRAIHSEHILPDGQSILNAETLGRKLGLGLSPDAVARFLGMVDGTTEFIVTLPVAAADALDPADFATEPAMVVSPHNAVRGEQKLTYRGALLDVQQTALETRFANLSAGEKGTFSAMLTGVRLAARDVFDSELKAQALRRPDQAGFLKEADYARLFSPLTPLLPPDPADTADEIADKATQNAAIQEANRLELADRHRRVAMAYLPHLQTRLIRQFILQTLTAQTEADPELLESLLTDERVLGLPPDASKPLLDGLDGISVQGIDATFFDSADLTGPPQKSAPHVSSADTTLKDTEDITGNPLGRAGSARFEGYLEVPAAGAYRFYVLLDKVDAQFTLRFDHLPNSIHLQGTATAVNAMFGEGSGEFLELKPGLPYRFALEVTNLGDGEARLLVQGETMSRSAIGRLTLYPESGISTAKSALLLLSKALRLLQALGLTDRETRYLLTHSSDFGNVNLSHLPTKTVGNTAPEQQSITAAFNALLRLITYTRLKRALAGDTDDLITLFEAAAAGGPAAAHPHIARLARRNEATIAAAVDALWPASAGPTPALTNEQSVMRLWGALQVMERFGVSVASIKQWLSVVSVGTTDDEARFAIARDARDVIKARFEPEAWQRVAKPIFDRLRKHQRDALVAHVLHTSGFDRLEQLYEFFLIDPGMEPTVQTSRIRLAIASVQLFIQRCLLNLEAKVHPSAILNAEHWEWMKRYRVWEANRKIFLFPENWLEPEFRDDKSHLFAELEGTLLQGDVSRDLAEDAFLNYLRKLDELARLDVVSMHLEQRDDPGQNVLHVFGRTYSEPHKYFYRRFAAGMWTPWEPMSLELQGDHLAPVIWRSRLYLFWVTFIDTSWPDLTPLTVDPTKPITLSVPTASIEAHLHWSEHINGEWTTQESSPLNGPGVISFQGASLTEVKNLIVHVSKRYSPAPEGAELGVYIHLSGEKNKASFYLAGRNSAPVKDDEATRLPNNPYTSATKLMANRRGGDGPLKVKFLQTVITEVGQLPKTTETTEEILGQSSGGYTVLPLNGGLGLGVPKEAFENADEPEKVKAALESTLLETESLIKPVFFQDDKHTFFVEPNVIERTIEQVETWLEPAKTTSNDLELGIKLGSLDDYVIAYVGPLIGPYPPVDPAMDPPGFDWLTNATTVVLFDDKAMGRYGGIPMTKRQVGRDTTTLMATVRVSDASAVGNNEVFVFTENVSFEEVGLERAATGLNVVGSSGLNTGIMENVSQHAEAANKAALAKAAGAQGFGT